MQTDLISAIWGAIFAAIVFVIVLVWLFWEKYRLRAARRRLKYVIHVNGIRGKSTVTRLIAAGFRACGYATACKTTGTVPVYSGPDGVERVITRLGPANIREQMRTLRRAARDGAEVLVIECMAVSPELQALCEHRILHADICVMTKILPDHTDVLGSTESRIALSLSNTVPRDGVLITLPDNYAEVFADTAALLNASVVISPAVPPSGAADIDRFPENLQLACAVAAQSGLPAEAFLAGVRTYTPDPYAYEVIRAGTLTFFNAFSANDPSSILRLYAQCCNECGGKPAVLLNTRGDRPERALQHIEMLKQMQPPKVLLMGDGLLSVSRRLQAAGLHTEEIVSPDSLLSESCVFACGNIHGKGQKLIAFLKQGGDTHG